MHKRKAHIEHQILCIFHDKFHFYINPNISPQLLKHASWKIWCNPWCDWTFTPWMTTAVTSALIRPRQNVHKNILNTNETLWFRLPFFSLTSNICKAHEFALILQQYLQFIRYKISRIIYWLIDRRYIDLVGCQPRLSYFHRWITILRRDFILAKSIMNVQTSKCSHHDDDQRIAFIYKSRMRVIISAA